MRRFRLAHHLKTSLWSLPLVFVLVGVALSMVSTSIDDGSMVPQHVSGDPTAALQILYLIAFSMLTLTGLVLSLVVVVVQLAMGVFSPRIVRQILQDRPSQCAIGLFAGTFAHAILSIRAIDTTPEGGTVPGLAVLIAYVLVLACIGTLIWYVNHIGQALRVAALVGWVSRDTLRTLDTMLPDSGPAQESDPNLLITGQAGVIFMIDHARLVDLATSADCRLDMLWPVGDFVPTGSALMRVSGDPGQLSPRAAVNMVAIGPERTLNQDVAYGIRMLVDIAQRSLAAGPLDDPTTAVQAIDRLHDILRQIVRRPLHSGEYHDAAGVLRLFVPTLRWEGYVRVAFDEIRLAGAGSPQISRRLTAAIVDLLSIAPPDRRPPLQEQLDLLGNVAAVSAANEADQEAALTADASGIGSAQSLLTSIDPEPGQPAQGAPDRN